MPSPGRPRPPWRRRGRLGTRTAGAGRRAGSLGPASRVTRVVATSSRVDAIAVTRQAVWLAVGGLVLRVDPATGRALVVPGVEAGAPVVDLAAGAGAVWAATSDTRLLGLGGPHVRGPRRKLDELRAAPSR